MVISDADRRNLYTGLEEVLGPVRAEVLMEHLPPVGWADVATKDDLYGLEERLNAQMRTMREEVGVEIATLSGKIDTDIATLSGKIDTGLESLSGKIDTEIEGLSGKIDTGFQSLSGKYPGFRQILTLPTARPRVATRPGHLR